jgi:hypothetical protein
MPPPQRHGLPLIVKFSVLAFCGLLVLTAISVAITAASGGWHHDDGPSLAEKAASCTAAHGKPYDNLRYPYIAMPTRPELPPLDLDVQPGHEGEVEARTISRESLDDSYISLASAAFYGLGDDQATHDDFLNSTLTALRDGGITPEPITVHGHHLYRYSVPAANPNNYLFGSTTCGELLVLANTDHDAAALWRRLVEPPAGE